MTLTWKINFQIDRHQVIVIHDAIQTGIENMIRGSLGANRTGAQLVTCQQKKKKQKKLKKELSAVIQWFINFTEFYY